MATAAAAAADSGSKTEEYVIPVAGTTVAGPRKATDPAGVTWQQTMLRIKDPSASVPYYQTHYGFTLIDKLDFPQWKFSLYFMAILAPGVTAPEPGTQAAHDFLWTYPGVTLELTHNYGTESDADFKYNNGNVEPHRGFGHIAVMTKDVYAACATLEAAGVKFQKRPDEGRMKGLAFALDPDGYWVEIISSSRDAEGFTLAQTMLRVKDPVKSVKFFEEHFNMTLICRRHFREAKFSLYFMATLPAGTELPDVDSPEAHAWMKSWDGCVLELTHNHGTEADPAFSYHDGNKEPRGYGHIGFLVPDVYEFCERLEKAGVSFFKKPNDGAMKGLAFALDPDGYRVEIIKHGWDMQIS